MNARNGKTVELLAFRMGNAEWWTAAWPARATAPQVLQNLLATLDTGILCSEKEAKAAVKWARQFPGWDPKSAPLMIHPYPLRLREVR